MFSSHYKKINKKKIAIVTGANSGIGFYITLGLVRKKFHVIMACRDLEKANQAKIDITDLIKKDDRQFKPSIEVMSLNLAHLESVTAFANTIHDNFTHLNLLINNAGG